jgi:hypothetical protein
MARVAEKAPLLLIRIKKGRDGGGALSCVRGDGSVVYQRQNAKQAGFFVRHDLTHFAVESVLRHRKGFYGLLADGWDFDDFGAKWDKKKLPADIDPSELIVGLFDAEHRGTERWSAAQFNEYATRFCESAGAMVSKPFITDEQIARVRRRLDELLAQWEAVEPGGTLELEFEPSA